MLAGNAAAYGGGAAYGQLRQCTLVGNWATNEGGGTYRAEVVECLVASNAANSTGGGAQYGRLDRSQVVSNNAANGGGAANAEMFDCTVVSNTARTSGGGVYFGLVSDSRILGNLAFAGGGMYGGSLLRSLLSSNQASSGCGGAYGADLVACEVSANVGGGGGGVVSGSLRNCVVIGNQSRYYGGGLATATAVGCLLASNSAFIGGGAWLGTLSNCTLVGNTAVSGGGASTGTLYNCIIYYNHGTVDANASGCVLSYCCTTPLAAGSGNFTNEPGLVDIAHVGAGSPCLGAGQPANATGADIDGDPWRNPPAVGCDEVNPGATTGHLSVSIWATPTNAAVGFPVNFMAFMLGRVTGSAWDFGDGSAAVSNQAIVDHAFAAPGRYDVVLRGYNETWTDGVAATVNVQVVEVPVHYVTLDSTNPVPPYLSWATAATNIQDAIDAAHMPGALVLVTNGTYAVGGQAVYATTTNRVAITRPIVVRSVNGPAVTSIKGLGPLGDAAVRCCYVGPNAMLAGFTLSGGFTRSFGDSTRSLNGGGAWCDADGVLSNCVLVGNTAQSEGGGVYGGTCYDCLFTGNVAGATGGGAVCGTLIRCLLTSNTAQFGGGAAYSSLVGCRLTGNRGSMSGGGALHCKMSYCGLNGNVSAEGGGLYWGELSNGYVTDNRASVYGGGARHGLLNNCTVIGNQSPDGGGTYRGTQQNCIVYYNISMVASNHSGGVQRYCCTAPLPPGSGHITNEPGLLDATHLYAGSPCAGAGSAAFASGMDIDGEPWRDPPAIGCDEIGSGPVTGGLAVSFTAAPATAPVDYAFAFVAYVQGAVTRSTWNFGDGSPVVSNQALACHAFAAAGSYPVVLRGYNDDYPDGVAATTLVQVVEMPVHFVSLHSTNPVPPYASWATAATNIQAAIDAALMPGALVLVSNGVYAAGGRAMVGSMTNRVTIDKAVVVRSVNGPAVTVIQGGGPLGDTAVRGVYVGSNAVLAGFTVSNGYTRTSGDNVRERSGGGVWCELGALVSNCVLAGNAANIDGGGSYFAVLYDCVVTGNVAASGGGGCFYGQINRSLLVNNKASLGGGIAHALARDSRFVGNAATSSGGGAYNGTLLNCQLIGNLATNGGGANLGLLNNCLLFDNRAASVGGGCYRAALNNCTVVYNAAASAGGADGSTQNNCIVYYNVAPTNANYSFNIMQYCCTTSGKTGVGIITNEPGLASVSHLALDSPCRGAASAAWVAGVDLDGETWLNPPSIGCDEVVIGAHTGGLEVAISASATNVLVGLPVTFTASIDGRAFSSAWHFGDGSAAVSNRPCFAYTFTNAGLFPVELKAFNETNPQGVAATVLVQVVASSVHYVDAGCLTPVPPYLSWATAATSIQEAVDVAYAGSMVLVTDGVYAAGGRVVYGSMTNRVVIDRPLVVRSVNGPRVTAIAGEGSLTAGAVRCAYIGAEAWLAGFTLRNGFTRNSGDSTRERSGGGIWSAPGGVVSNCILFSNQASADGGGAYGGSLYDCVVTGNTANGYGGGACSGSVSRCLLAANIATRGGGAFGAVIQQSELRGNTAAGDGGGAYASYLSRCVVVSNYASSSGGGIYLGTAYNGLLASNLAAAAGGGAAYGGLYNCVLTRNFAPIGGGVYLGTQNNCIIQFNVAQVGSNYQGALMRYCCTSPHPGGSDDINRDPLFADPAVGDYHLLAASPCIDHGANAYAAGGLDLDGNLRLINWIVDMGAYEYQGVVNPDTDGDGIPNDWEGSRGLDAAVSNAPIADADADGSPDVEEYTADTRPTDPGSFFPELAVTDAPPILVLVIDPTSTARVYSVQAATDLLDWPLTWQPYGESRTGTGSRLLFTVSNDVPQRLFRTGVRLP